MNGGSSQHARKAFWFINALKKRNDDNGLRTYPFLVRPLLYR